MHPLTQYILSRVSQEGKIGHDALVKEFTDCLQDHLDSGILADTEIYDGDSWEDSGYELTDRGREMVEAQWPGAPR